MKRRVAISFTYVSLYSLSDWLKGTCRTSMLNCSNLSVANRDCIQRLGSALECQVWLDLTIANLVTIERCNFNRYSSMFISSFTNIMSISGSVRGLILKFLDFLLKLGCFVLTLCCQILRNFSRTKIPIITLNSLNLKLLVDRIKYIFYAQGIIT